MMCRQFIAEKQREQANLIGVLARTPLPAIEAEVVRLQREIDEHTARQAAYTERQIQDVPEDQLVVKLLTNGDVTVNGTNPGTPPLR